MNPILLLLLLISIIAKARTRRDRLKATLVILAVLSQQQGRAKLANLRRYKARNTSDDSLVVHLLAALREEPTGVNDPHTSDIMKKIRKGNEIQFRQMFRVSRLVFEAVLAELSPFLNDDTSRNHQQNIPARLKLGVALYYMAHGGDAIHPS